MKPRLKPISEQTVVLVGATSGIGLETALQMVEKGARVVIVGRSQEGLNDAQLRVQSHADASRMSRSHGSNGKQRRVIVAEEAQSFADIEAGGAPVSEMEEQVVAIEGDVTSFEQMKSVADQVISRFGRIDTWANIAAVSEWALFEDTSPDEFHRIIEVNLLGQAYGAMAVLPYLKQQQGGGSLIFVSSIAGRVPIPFQSAYSASKHGIVGLAETLRLEVRHTGAPVSVTNILPASMNTPLFDKARTKIGVEPEPIRPVYDAQMVARAIVYAAEHPVRELIVGDAGYMMTFMRRLAPTLTSNFMGATGFRQQRSDEPKSAQAPDNLYHHMSGYNTVEGDVTPRTNRFSMLTWFSTHPKARMALYGGLLGGAGALVGWRIVSARRARRGWRYQLPLQAKRITKMLMKRAGVAGKGAQKVAKKAGKAVVAMPVVSSMPMFRKRSFVSRAGDVLSGLWAATIAILPFTRQKSLVKRISDRMPDISISRRKTEKAIDRLTLAEQRKSAVKRFAKESANIAMTVKDQRKAAIKAISKRVPSKSDIKDLIEKEPVVVRKQSLVERMPFGTRRQTIVETMPVKK